RGESLLVMSPRGALIIFLPKLILSLPGPQESLPQLWDPEAVGNRRQDFVNLSGSDLGHNNTFSVGAARSRPHPPVPINDFGFTQITRSIWRCFFLQRKALKRAAVGCVNDRHPEHSGQPPRRLNQQSQVARTWRLSMRRRVIRQVPPARAADN